jgi:hypothetical protein
MKADLEEIVNVLVGSESESRIELDKDFAKSCGLRQSKQ